MPIQTGDDIFGVAQFIVDGVAGYGTHTTVQAAVTSAAAYVITSGKNATVFIRPGTYTENITLSPGVNLAAFECDALTPNVTISGTCTLTTAGIVSISGIRLQTNSAALLAVTGSAASVVNLHNCYLNCTNNTGISFTTSSGSGAINLYQCNGDLGTTGIGFWNSSSPGIMQLYNFVGTNSGSSLSASTNSAGGVFIRNCYMLSVLSTTSTGLINVDTSTIASGPTGVLNTTALSISGIAGLGSRISYSNFVSNTASAITIGAGATLIASGSCTISSSNTNAITGVGIFGYSALTFTDSSVKINTTTQIGGTLQGGVTQAPSAGFLGELIEAKAAAGSVSLSSGVATTITSITLTPGIWNVVGGIEFFGGAGTTIGTSASVSLVDNTMGPLGDTTFSGSNSLVGTYDGAAVVPAVRLTLTATTTVYLVASTNISAGTVSAGGRISATRVG